MWDYSNIVEVTIDRPAKEVWPYFFGKKNAAWTKTDYTPIAGQSGKVGEIYAMAYPIANQGGQLYFEAIKVMPEKQLVLKITYKENENSERKLSGYDFITLNEVAGRTTVVLQQATELSVDPTTDLNLQTEKHDKFLADIFQNLKRMVEADLISTVHWVLHTELTLERPVSEVWPVFKDMKAWYTEYTFEVVSGPSYQAGSGLLEDQVLKLTSSKGFPRASNSEDAAGPQHFIQKTIKIAPQKEIVAVLSGRAYDWRQYSSFYVWRMTEKATKTTIFVDSYGEAELVTPLPKGEVSDYHDTLTRNWHRSWSEAFVSLRKLLDADK